MAKLTEKTFRGSGKWVKVTRDNEKKTFTYALGWEGCFKAHQIETWPFKYDANWKEAADRANSQLTT